MKPVSRAANPWAPNAEGVSVRLLSPAGSYPTALAFRYADAAIIVEKDLIALITKFAPIASPNDYYSEVAFLSAFEVRALAPIFLAKKFETGAMALYPVCQEYRELDASLDLSDKRALKPLVERFRSHLNASTEANRLEFAWRRCPYDFNEYCEIDRRRLPHLFRSIDVHDHLTIRGLGALVKAGMLSRHREFLEQACMSLWIALDASLCIVRRMLREIGYANPTAKDAGEFLDDAFGNKYASDGYFTDFYEERIKTLHPQSRFGTYPAAPLCADEYNQLNQSLEALYDFLLTGHVYKEWKGR
jgi:hypothetical protein